MKLRCEDKLRRSLILLNQQLISDSLNSPSIKSPWLIPTSSHVPLLHSLWFCFVPALIPLGNLISSSVCQGWKYGVAGRSFSVEALLVLEELLFSPRSNCSKLERSFVISSISFLLSSYDFDFYLVIDC